MQRVKKRLGRLEVGRAESFRKAVVDRPEERHRLRETALIAPEEREAGGGPQLPGQDALLSRKFQRLTKLVLGSGRGLRDALHPHKVALNAKQLGGRPEFFIALGAFYRPFNHREPLPDPTRLTQSLRHLRRDKTGRGVGFDEFAQAGAKQLQPGRDVATPDDELTLVTSTKGEPERQTILCRMVKEHSDVTVGHI